MFAIQAVIAAGVAGFVLGIFAGGGGIWAWNDWAEAREERAIALAQADVLKANDVARRAIEEGLEQRKAGFDEGVAKGRQQAARVGVRLAEVTKGAGFAPNCVAGPDAMALYKAALGSVTGGKIPDELLRLGSSAEVVTAPLEQPPPVVPARPQPAAAAVTARPQPAAAAVTARPQPAAPPTSSAPATRPKPRNPLLP